MAPSVAFLTPTFFRDLSQRHRLASSRWRCSASVQDAIVADVPIAVDGGVTAARGFRANGVKAGLKASGATDLALVLAEGPAAATAGAVFTQSQVRAAPVDLSAKNLVSSGGLARAVVLNSGQANAATGAGGAEDAAQTVTVMSSLLGCGSEEILICSTGVIGVRAPREKICAALPGALRDAGVSRKHARTAAHAIMTTDLVPKEAARIARIGGREITVGGMCKGSGMIHPDMATMLAVLTCDAGVERALWQRMVARSADASFNAITVDGDSSTNDSVIALCNGASALRVEDESSAEAVQLQSLLTSCMIDLAKQIARDGEGANVLVEVRVSGASSNAAARAVARTIASSNLNKAAIFGKDPNWGRIAAAAGRAGVPFNSDELNIEMGPYSLMRNGQPLNFDVAGASQYLSIKASAPPNRYLTDDDTVLINVSVGQGPGSGIAWGCDLSYKYVEINADYST